MNEITNKKEIKFVALYKRVSTSNQEDANTVKNQEMVLEEFAKDNGFIIVERYSDEGWSGDTLARPDLDRLRQDAKNKKWDAVIIYDPDRLARRYSYQELVIDELRESGVEVVFTTVTAPKNSEDKILYGVRGLFAEYERAKIAERFRLGKLRTVRDGHVIGSDAPYGYKYIKKNKDNGILHGFYEIIEDEARVVRTIFNWIANEGFTIRGVVKKLKELGIKPRKSKRGVWATSTLNHLLKNKSYVGEAQWGKSYATVPLNPLKEEKYKKNKKSSRRSKPIEEWINIKVPAIIEEDLFNRTRAKLESNFYLADRNKKNEYLLAGKIWCVCGQRRCGSSPVGGKNLYYRCNNRIRNFPMPPTCKEKGINARISDKIVWQKISGLMTSPELMQSQVKRWLDNTQNRVSISATDINSLKKEIESQKEKDNRYNMAYADGVFTLEKLKEYTSPIIDKIRSLEMQIAQARQDQEQIKSVYPSEHEIEEFAKEATKQLKNLKFKSKKAIVMNVVNKVVSTQEKLLVSGYIPINQNVTLCSSYRHRRSAKRRKIYFIQRTH
jgi:site-specific DNA recombinase